MAKASTAYDEKLRSILRTAAEIFAEKGYDRASIRDIARATNVSLSGLYYYFDSKEELLFLIQDHAFGTLLERLEKLLEGETDPVRKLRILMENHLRFFIGNMGEMKVLSHEADSLSGELQRRVNAKKKLLTEVGRKILEEVDPGTDLDLRVATLSLFGMMNWIYHWYRPGRDLPPEAMAREMSRLFLGGFLQDGAPLPEAASGPGADEPAPRIWGADRERP